MSKAETQFGGARGPKRGPGGAVAYRTGRPPSLVRESYRMEFDQQLVFLRKVIACDKSICRKQTVVTPLGKKVQITVEPSITERIRAVEVIGKFSGVATFGAEDQIPPAPTPSGYDLTALAVKDLAELERLLGKAQQPMPLLTKGNVEVHEHEQSGA